MRVFRFEFINITLKNDLTFFTLTLLQQQQKLIIFCYLHDCIIMFTSGFSLVHRDTE